MKHTLSYFILVLFASLWTSCSPSASEPQSATSLNQLPDIFPDYVDVTIPIKNTGTRTGSEVLQIYVKALKDVNGPSKSLRAFERVELKPGKSMDVTFQLEPEAFQFFDEKSNTMICVDTEDVEYTLYYGTSSREEDLKSLPIVIAGK